MEFPFLSIIALSPILFAILILMLPKDRGENARMLGLAAMVLGLVLSIYVYVSTYQNLPPAGTSWSQSLQFVEEHPWVPSIGLNYIVGVDGLSATLVLLTAIVGLGGVLISWSIDDRPREFYAFFMLLVAGVHGVFIAVDGFVLFFFYELAVLPMYVMIVVWGWKVTREYAAMKLTLYLLIGSFISLIAFLVLYFTPVEGGEALRTFSPVRDSACPERILAVAVVSKDITPRREAEEALRKSEETYRRLIEYSSEAIFIVSGGKISFANSRTEKMLGYPLMSVLGIRSEDLQNN